MIGKSAAALRRGVSGPPSAPELAVVAAVVLAVYVATNITSLLSLRDEGHLWYATLQTLLGEVLRRDFYSYDPGRYYWGVVWLGVIGDGVLQLRIAAAGFLWLGLVLALLALRSAVPARWGLWLGAALLVWWAGPWHKFYDCAIAMAAIFFGLAILKSGSWRTLFAAGMFVGLAAVFGRNHGVYTGLAMTILLLLETQGQAWRLRLRALLTLSAGVVVGFSPQILMVLFVPGYAEAFWAYLDEILSGTGLPRPKPVPWLWTLGDLRIRHFWHLHAASFSVMLTLFPAAYAAILLWSYRTRRSGEGRSLRQLLTACGVLGLIYSHHTYARADVPHLMQASAPFVVACGALLVSLCRHRGSLRWLGVVGTTALLYLTATVPSARVSAPHRVVSRVFRTLGLASDPVRRPPVLSAGSC